MSEEEFVETIPSMFTVEAETDRNGNTKMKTVKLPPGRKSASYLIKSTVGTSGAARAIGAQTTHLSAFLNHNTTLTKAKRVKLNRLLKKLYKLRVAGQI